MRMRAERCQMRSVTPGVRALKNKRGVESVQHPQSLQLAGPCAKMHWSVSKDVCCTHDARVQLDDNAQSRDMSAPCRQVRSCTFNRYHVRSDYGATHLQHNFAQAPGSARFKGGGVWARIRHIHELLAVTVCGAGQHGCFERKVRGHLSVRRQRLGSDLVLAVGPARVIERVLPACREPSLPPFRAARSWEPMTTSSWR